MIPGRRKGKKVMIILIQEGRLCFSVRQTGYQVPEEEDAEGAPSPDFRVLSTKTVVW